MSYESQKRLLEAQLGRLKADLSLYEQSSKTIKYLLGKTDSNTPNELKEEIESEFQKYQDLTKETIRQIKLKEDELKIHLNLRAYSRLK
jgi:hypothetical protein